MNQELLKTLETHDEMGIHTCVKEENFEKIKELLMTNPMCVEELDASGIPVSFRVAETGNIEILKYIVEYSRASMNTIDYEGKGILHYGAMSGSLDVVTYLVEKVGMSGLSGDKQLITPFDMVHEKELTEIEQYFEKKYDGKYEDFYKNPIRTGMFPDPSVVRVEDDYYMVNSSFIYFPCIPISHSKDLIHWKIIGYAVTNPEWAMLDELEGGRGYWAPDISYHKGKFYITATYRMNDIGTVYRKQLVVSSNKPEGPYSKPIFIDEDGIDPSIFNDVDGKRYMLLNRGARILQLNEDATQQISEATLLYYGDQKRAPEAPHLLKKDGYYYLFLAEGGTGIHHRISVARSKTLMGNYEACPYNPIMNQRDEKAGLQRCGHGKPVMTQNGEWYMVYLCGRYIGKGFSILGRETALDPISWTEDGWPIVNNLNGPSTLQKKPNLEDYSVDNTDIDDFEKDTLGLDWMFPRTPDKDGYHIKNNRLWLKGSQAPLSQKESRNIILRRQSYFSFSAETKLDIVDMKKNQNTGLICYYDENTWLQFALFQHDNNHKYLKVMEHIGLVDREYDKSILIPHAMQSIYLKVVTRNLEREFYYSFDGVTYDLLAKLFDVNYLSDEGLTMGKRFTGAMVGLYVYSGQETLVVPFDYFHIYEI